MKPETIISKQFPRRLAGFAPAEVKAFLEKLADRMEQTELSLEKSRAENQALRSELKEYRDRGASLENALAQTKANAEEVKANAQREAELTVAEAELRAEKILGQAHNRLARIHEDIAELRRQRVQFEVRLRSLVEAHLKLLDLEGGRDRELADLEDKIKFLRAPNNS